jgi:hypothetical protein
VLDGEGAHLEAVVPDGLTRSELDQLDLVAELAEYAPQRLEECMEPRRTSDPERLAPLEQVIGLEQAGQAEVVVSVEVGDVDVVDLNETGRVDHLALGALPRVDEDARAPGPDQHTRRRPPRRGHGAAGAEKDHREIHGPPSLGRTQHLDWVESPASAQSAEQAGLNTASLDDLADPLAAEGSNSNSAANLTPGR